MGSFRRPLCGRVLVAEVGDSPFLGSGRVHLSQHCASGEVGGVSVHLVWQVRVGQGDDHRL